MFHPVVGRICVCWALIGATSAGMARDYFTEVFNGDFDLSYTTFTFKPDYSSNGYAVCRLPATEFPTAPTNGYTIFNSYGGGGTAPLNVGFGLTFYGNHYAYVQVSANGSVTYGDYFNADAGLDSSVSNHFRLPRVSAWLGSLGTSFARPVHVRSLSNLVALTWIDQPDGARGGSNNVQLELFFDGVIRLTFLRMDASNGVVGLSPGGGIPIDFAESNLSSIGCAGQALYELVWSAPSTAQAGQPFPVALAGRDAFNLDFPVNGPARLGAGQRGAVIFHTDFEQGASGFTFTNSSGGYTDVWHLSTYRGTQLGHSPSHSMYFGSAESSSPQERDSPPASSGRLVSPRIDLRGVYPPITLSFAHFSYFNSAFGGTTLQVEDRSNAPLLTYRGGGVYPSNTSNQWVTSVVDLSAFSGEEIHLRFGAGSDGGRFHENEGWLVDDITITGTTNSIPVSPSLTGAFSGNSWSGNISIGAPASGLVLIAAHSNGVYGLSAPMNIGMSNDLSLGAQMKFPNLQLGHTGSVDIVVSNTGPDGANAVVVTNQLPPGVTLGNVAVSQGSFSISGNRLLLDFGAMGGGGYALSSFEFMPTNAGTLFFTSTVARTASETFLENNHSVTTVNVGEPAVSVAATSASEGATNMVLLLQLDTPSPLPVSVCYTTVSGLAIAGEDFVATNGFVTFPPFATNAEVRVRIIDDGIVEVRPYDGAVPPVYNDEPEYFTLQLTTATNAALGFASARGTIVENDPMPALLVITTNLPEGNFGTNLVPVIFQLSGPAAAAVDVDYYTESGVEFHLERGGYWLFGTAFDRQLDAGAQDFVPVPLGTTFNFAPGETQRVVYIPVIGDTTTEPNEFFTVVTTSGYLRRPTIGAPHPLRYTFSEVTIIDDDPSVLAVDDYQVVAENCGTNNHSLDPGETVTVLLRVRNVGYNACTSSNFMATLLAGGGVVNPSGPQLYGAMCGGGPEVWRPFTFTVGAACGSKVTATLAFSDNGTNLGTSSLAIPVGARGRALSENFDSVSIPNLPAGWVGGPYPYVPWSTTNEPPANTNQFVRIVFGGIPAGAVALDSPPFVITSSDAWLRLRHRFEFTPINVGTHLSLRSGNDSIGLAGEFYGSSRGWTVSNIPLPPASIGSTQSLHLELVRLDGNLTAIWEIDSIDVFGGPAACCDGAAPFVTSIRRTNNSTILQWTSISNRTYQLQFQPTVHPTQSWNDAGAPVLAQGPLTAHTNVSSASNAFYRVRLNP